MKYFILILFLLPISCGTETGNPLVEGGLANGDAPFSAVRNVIVQVCNKLEECYGDDFDGDSCIANLAQLDNFDVALGLNEFDYATADDIYFEEMDGYIVANTLNSAQCVLDINGLTCSDTEVVDAFDPNDPANLDNTHKLVPIGAGSCQDVYN